MRLKSVFTIFISIMIIFINSSNIFALTEDNNTLIIYPSTIKEDNLDLRVLDITVSHFSNNIDFVKTNSQIENIDEYDYVIYYGLVEEQINSNIINKLDRYKGKLIGIGYNVEQIKSKFSFIKYGDELVIDNITFKGRSHKLESTKILRGIDKIGEGKVLQYTNVKGKKIPWFVSNEAKDTYYFAFTNLFTELSYYLGEGLFECFNKQQAKVENQKTLRLEDITPARNPDVLMEVAKYLKEKEIPYMVVVIPTHRDVENNKTYHLKDYPEMIKTLKYMQENGGSIVMHGYTHQYRDSETGEGFEFWDSELDAPLDRPNGISEDKYVREKIEAGIEQLVTHDLYPIAFEAPHYAISQNGYKVVSEYFSTYVGQIQISDETMETTYSPVYKSNPTFLNGMTVIPENLGFLGENSFEEDLKSIKYNSTMYSDFSDGMIGVFYHPHLGIEKLRLLIETLEESTPNLEWFDLRSIDSITKTSDLKIEVSEGDIEVEKSSKMSPYQARVYSEYTCIGVVVIILLVGVKYVFQIKLFKKK